MEGITEINKEDYIDDCVKIVKELVVDEDFSEEIWHTLTAEIMDTCLFIGGDFGEENIRDITNQYITSNGIVRFKKAHGIR
ncbi:MAG: hypothetical protein KHX14_07465 [[Clostridium] spiroforme]|uniref:Uncharacterized protein n=1 Tax=Thomasclavelia spiroformis TaxID=29348 RepID=A0A943I3L9_9FIRM|nr:hypothetical protein [Thomasclavelia spiroformis]MBS5588638.1 hypothetical protein [Thomasclavelia spiroformis]